MNLPTVAIVGRPNVGKSTLFNMLIRQRIAIEEPTAGVTRDRIGSIFSYEGKTFQILDTGGIGIEDSMGLSDEVEAQIRIALEQADVLMFVVDIKVGITPLDELVAQRLRQLQLPIVLVANKCDSRSDEMKVGDIFRLGLGEPVFSSARQRDGRYEVLDAVWKLLPETPDADVEEPEIKLAIVGKRNVGKSSLVNALAREDRVIVSEIAGTTRDAIDVRIEIDGKRITAIDTAGIRKKGKMADSIEFFSFERARRSIRRADVVLLMFDCTEEISRLDRQLAEEIVDTKTPCIVTINKWDLNESGVSVRKFSEYIKKTLKGFDYAPMSFISAQTRLNLIQTIRLAFELYEQAGVRVGTGELNRAIEAITIQRSPPHKGGKQGRIYYSTQVSVHPPTFIMFVNRPHLFDANYLRYVERRLREQFPFPEIPLNVILKSAHKEHKQRQQGELLKDFE
ncbi:MAG: ribosome biogenesis GTPase Der [Planctomycetota bacterium]|jgi:GTP-binding protein|nr:ribosome biogenesis GTPase Der [Planctomycetota bacterium]